MKKHFSAMEASTIMRVMRAIERQIWKANSAGRYEDADCMARIYVRLTAAQFGGMTPGWYDSPLALPPTAEARSHCHQLALPPTAEEVAGTVGTVMELS